MNTKPVLLALLITFLTVSISAQQKVIQLYPAAAPGSESWNWDEKENENNAFNTKVVYNVSHPTLTVFSPDSAVVTGAAVIICPGGGFHTLSINSEGNNVARWLNRKGVVCFVLKYRLVHSLTDNPVQELIAKMGKREFEEQTKAVIPLAIADGREAIAYVRKHAAAYGISPDKIGIIGFSAGGTVAASAAFNYTQENRPAFVAPIYAFMPDSLQGDVPGDAPPMFIAAATNDPLGLAPHSISLYNKWVGAKHSAELHLYSKGGHGFGMRKQNLPSDKWVERFYDWLQVQGFLK